MDFSHEWKRAYQSSPTLVSGKFRSSPEEFCVDEELGYEPSGDGEHRFLYIEKTGQNTLWVIDEMARQLGTERALFGYCGIKDRHAITRQWISVQDPKSQLIISRLNIPGVRILSVGRHKNKLRPGSHSANSFRLQLRDLSCNEEGLTPVLESLSNGGFPNYFGAQRFGFDGDNLVIGWRLLQKRTLGRHKKKGIYLSALRSFLFNQVLSARIADKSIGAIGLAAAKKVDDLVVREMDSLELDGTGPLWGRGRSPVSGYQQRYEAEELLPWKPLCEALEYAGLSQERRELFVTPAKLAWEWLDERHLALSFSLPPGSYATSVLRELGDIVDDSKTGSAL